MEVLCFGLGRRVVLRADDVVLGDDEGAGRHTVIVVMVRRRTPYTSKQRVDKFYQTGIPLKGTFIPVTI